jgi:membrane-bound inhibitor of C-type lysozyme
VPAFEKFHILLPAMFALLPAAAVLDAARADEAPRISITVENGGSNARTTAHYQCDGKPVDVDYINVEPDFLAVLPVEGRKRIFVLGMSGSGARYQSGRYVWWSKGKEASLYDQMKGENAPPIMTCSE